MSTVDSNAEDDVWGKDSSTFTIMQRPKASKVPVRDSWDDDDDDDPISEPNLIWERENARTPMPQIQLSTTTAVSGLSLPPPAAFKTPLKILKRPGSEAKSPPTSPPNSQTTKSLQEREARYQAARERIFGDKETEKDGNASPLNVAIPSLHEQPRSVVIRDPIGPQTGSPSNNFQQRRKKEDSLAISPQGLRDKLNSEQTINK